MVVSKEEFLIPSQSSDKKYKIINISGWNCEYQNFQNILKQSLIHLYLI